MQKTKALDDPQRPSKTRTIYLIGITITLALSAMGAIAGGIYLSQSPELIPTEGGNPLYSNTQIMIAALLAGGLLGYLTYGIWALKNWSRSLVLFLVLMGGTYYGVSVIFDVSAQIFGGEKVVPLLEIGRILISGLKRIIITGAVPIAVLYGLRRYAYLFEETAKQRRFIDQSVRYILIGFALSAIIIVALIIVFTFMESMQAITEVGLDTMLLGTIWRPGSIIGTEDAQLGLIPMVIGSILSTFGAALLGVPFSIGAAILLAEVAPISVREVIRPAIELLAGIPSVVYGLFGMVVLAPAIRTFQIPYNSGFNLLNASIILAVMITPTVTNIAEDAIRAVPREYKEGSFALGTTHWQTIWFVILPSARSGIIAAVILGIGRALGETMALIMVIGNAIAIPKPLNNNPLTLFLSAARTLTGNIAVEINYATGAHRSALFFTGLLLFLMIFLVNSIARGLMRERTSS
ncbi:MAG: phosphate ABC transporter permease subunit PstC [Anaerolineales bacterium]